MNKWNGKRFSIYDKEEKQVLGLLNNLGEQTNYNTDEVERLTISDNKKVTHEEMKSKYKIDENANFTGSWFGLKRPTESSEGLASTVEQLIDETIPGINSQLEQNKNNINYSLPLTKFTESKKAWPKRSKNGRYEAWPYGNVFYDESIDKVCLVYNSKSTHTSTDGKVYFRSKSDFGKMSNAILVASATLDADTTYPGRRCHGAGIDKDGNYLALILHHGHLPSASGDGLLWIYKSTDKGNTWSKSKAIVDGSELLTGECGSCYKLKNGRLLSFARLSPSPSSGCKIIYSDNNGESWNGYKLNTGSAKEPLEGMFIELSDSSIYCIVRGTLFTGRFDVYENTYITHSNDGGVSWTPLEKLENIDMTLNNGCLIYHEDIKAIEMIYGSRFIKADGKGSLYQRIFTEAQLKKHDLGTENRIGQGASSSDFGYVGGCKSKQGVVNLFYYNGDDSDTDIYNMEGTREVFKKVDGASTLTLPWGTLDGSEKPSYFNKFIGEVDSAYEGRIILQRFGDNESLNNENLPIKKRGIMEICKISPYNGNLKVTYTTIDNEIFTKVSNNANEDTWSKWKKVVTMSNLINDNTLIKSPFIQRAETQQIYLIPTSPITSNMSLDIKSIVNNDYYNNYVDGVRLEVIYKGSAASGTQVLCFTSNDFSVNNISNNRIVTSGTFEQNYYIDCFVSNNTKDVKMTIKNPSDVQTLIIRVVGFIFKDMIFN